MSRKEPVITEENPLVIKKLKVYPDKLEYKRVRCNFCDIEHIDWYWQSQRINFLNMQDTTLGLYIRGRDKPVYIRSSTIYKTPKIVAAYKFIAKETFQSRLHYYTSQLDQSGSFISSDCSIYSDGRVVSGGKTFSLSRAEISAFNITIRQGGIFSPKVRINLGLDGDVILTLIDFILKNPKDPRVYVGEYKRRRERAEQTKGFLLDLVPLMAKLSKADGRISPEEIEIVKSFLLETMKLDEDAFSRAVSIFNHAKASPTSFGYFAERLFSRFKGNNDMLSATLDLLFSIAIADGVLSAEEAFLLSEAESIFGIKGRKYGRFKAQEGKQRNNSKEYYLKILGLSPGATQERIRFQYKRLVMRFHPDRVQHRGEEFVKEAQAKMKEINRAYEYLRRD